MNLIKKKHVTVHAVISLIMAFFILYLLSNYVYRISFAFYYSYNYALVFNALTILGGIGCFLVIFFRAKFLFLSRYLLAPPLIIATVKLIMNLVTLLVYETKQESFDILVTGCFLLSIYTLLNSLSAINQN